MPNQGLPPPRYGERRSSSVDRVATIVSIALLRGGKTSTAVIGLALALAVVGQLLLDVRAAVPVAAGLCLLAVLVAALPRPCPSELSEPPARQPWTGREVA